MTCDRIQPLLSSYHDDALSIEQRAQVRAHVATCTTCRSILDAYETIYATLRSTAIPVPADLRRNVYARIAELEARQGGRLPFGPTLLGALRGAGGTAGLLAVLAALVAAIVHMNSAPLVPTANGRIPAHAVVSNTALIANSTPVVATIAALAGSVANAAVTDKMGSLPPAAQTAIAPLQQDRKKASGSTFSALLKSFVEHTSAGWYVTKTLITGGWHRPGSLVTIRISVPMKQQHAMSSPTIVVGTPTPIPTVPPGDGLVYLHLDNSNPFLPAPATSNSPAEIEFHSFGPNSTPQTLVTPVASQLFSGINASADGNSFAYTVLGRVPRTGGIFRVLPRALQPQHLITVTSTFSAQGRVDSYIHQAYLDNQGHVFGFVQTNDITSTIAVTAFGGIMQEHAVGAYYDYAVSPDGRHLAWINGEQGDYGTLQIVTLGVRPMTQTIISPANQHLLVSQPVWSPNGRSLLLLGKTTPIMPHERAGLYLWSQGGSLKQVLQPAPNSPQLDDYVWSPDGRLCAYILTNPDAHRGTSQVWLLDTQTGYTWEAFQRPWIGIAAWVHQRAVAGLPSTVAAPTPPPLPVIAGSAEATPTAYSATDSPENVLLSYHNAISRHDFKRARSYLGYDDHRTLAEFASGYTNTVSSTIVTLKAAPYMQVSNFHALTCVGVQLVSIDRDPKTGTTTQSTYGGWYLVESTSGQNPAFGGWRILISAHGAPLHYSHMTLNGTMQIPTEAECTGAVASAA